MVMCTFFLKKKLILRDLMFKDFTPGKKKNHVGHTVTGFGAN